MIEISQITGANILPDVSRDLKNSVSLGWWVIPRFTAKIVVPCVGMGYMDTVPQYADGVIRSGGLGNK